LATRIAINGYGRIGRNILRAIVESGRTDEFDIVAINDLGSIETNAHLTQYDSIHGRFNTEVSVDGDHLVVGGDRFKVYAERDPSKLPWGELDVDVVLECTGVFRDKEKANLHIQGGAKKVLISAPGKGDIDATVVYGVNHETLTVKDKIVSNASCTTNCLAPLAKALNDEIGIVDGLMTTIHAYTNGQAMIPTSTGAAVAGGLVLPELAGKLDGFAVRVPTSNVSLVDLTFTAKKNTTVEALNAAIKKCADGKVLAYNDAELVSIDYNHNSASSNFDATLTRVMDGNLVKVGAWYDNEWAFSNRMLDTAAAMMAT